MIVSLIFDSKSANRALALFADLQLLITIYLLPELPRPLPEEWLA
jgi:hypothetical protein